ncbi:hypothetical protein CRG98_047722 [Punica granatum]|uniref:Uncharacterized protein n=1 Tax=Punica granatum TaxID=22663 RepID=A0A2I0HK89_PUNGR|nr:hypothetical protein CRG98_047722 [Punica granatum]
MVVLVVLVMVVLVIGRVGGTVELQIARGRRRRERGADAEEKGGWRLEAEGIGGAGPVTGGGEGPESAEGDGVGAKATAGRENWGRKRRCSQPYKSQLKGTPRKCPWVSFDLSSSITYHR